MSKSSPDSTPNAQCLGRIVERETLLQTSRFRVERRAQRLPDGSLHSREIVEHPGAVVILPILDDGRICLIRNYRISVDAELIELPAGTREPREEALLTAHRELQEETGFRAAKLQPLCEFLMSPGILNERMHAFVATGLSEGPQHLERGEDIQNLLVTEDELKSWIAQGIVQDAKTLTTLLFYWSQT